MSSVVFRVDAGPAIGLGHAMRCSTLAAELAARRHDVRVATTGMADPVRDRFEGVGVAVDVVGDPVAAITARSSDACVVDGYALGDQALQLSAHGCPLVMIDDNLELPVRLADLVLNQNPHAGDVPYTRHTDAALLLGLRFALIRSDVRSVGRRRRDPHGRGDVLVALGGTDSRRLTLDVTEAVLAAPVAEVVVAIGETHPQAEVLDRLCEGSARVRRASPDLLAELATVDLAVVGGGTTLWELAHVGAPAIAVVVADNQAGGSAAAQEAGTAVAIDARDTLDAHRITSAVEELMADPTRRRHMADRGRVLVDGRGVERVADAVEALLDGAGFARGGRGRRGQ